MLPEEYFFDANQSNLRNSDSQKLYSEETPQPTKKVMNAHDSLQIIIFEKKIIRLEQLKFTVTNLLMLPEE